LEPQTSNAERGQAIAEAALSRLRADQPLCVDELCNLIRSLEMTQSQPSTASTSHDDIAWVSVDPTVLDSYAGFYRRGEYGVTTIWRDGEKLFIDAPIPGSLGAVALHPTSETEFYPTHGAGYFQYTFLHNPQGAVSGVLTRVQGVELTSPRIDATTAEQLMAKLSERIQSQKPLPGSEAALRRLVEGIQAGNPPYEFRGVEGGGWDQYDAHCERGTSRWRILLSADGKMASASYDWDPPKTTGTCAD
jgi:hypothetical protein